MNNYGTKLQAYAVQEIMSEYGTVEIIDFKADLKWRVRYKPEKMLLQKYSDVKNASEKTISINLSNKRRNAIYSFDDKYVFAPACVGGKALREQATTYDAVVCGSDQIWNPVNLGSHTCMLEFVPDSVRRISLAPSFGIESVPNELKHTYQDRLKHIEYLSVREKSGVDILKNLGREDVFWCLDPTLLLKEEKWHSLAAESKKSYDEPYIFCYFLGNNPVPREVARKLREVTGAKVVNIPHFKSFVDADDGLANYDLYDATPQDFVNLIRNASFVCTDSFHGTAFSLIFEREVFSCERHQSTDIASTNGRLYSILSLLGIPERMVTDCNQVDKLLASQINYVELKSILDHKRNEAKEFLDNAIGGTRR